MKLRVYDVRNRKFKELKGVNVVCCIRSLQTVLDLKDVFIFQMYLVIVWIERVGSIYREKEPVNPRRDHSWELIIVTA